MDGRLLPTDVASPAGLLSSTGFALVLVERGEKDCTRESARGQFNIFGAVEENGCHGFADAPRSRRPFEILHESACWAQVLIGRKPSESNFELRESSLSTVGAQEMQKAKVSD